MTTLDIVMLLPLCFAFIRGWRKGLIAEIFSMLALILAIIACMKLTSFAMQILEHWLHGSPYLSFFSYALVFVAVYIGVMQIGNIFGKAAEMVFLGPVNQFAGGMFSMLKLLFMISLFIWLSDRIQFFPSGIRQQSFLYQHIRPFAPWVITKVTAHMPFFQGMIGKIENFFVRIK